MRRLLVVLAVSAVLGGCALGRPFGGDGPPPRGAEREPGAEPTPREEPRSRYGNPESYEVHGRRYYVMDSAANYSERGIASWYGRKFHGRRTSSGEPYDMYELTAAHKSLPLPTYARVTNLRNGRAITVKINDRGPFVDNRLIDLSYGAAKRLDMLDAGTAPVEVQALSGQNAGAGPAPAQPAEESVQAAAVETGNVDYYVQLGAFAEANNADAVRARAEAARLPAAVRVQPITQEGRALFRVRVGPVTDADTVDRITQRLAAHGLTDSQVVVE